MGRFLSTSVCSSSADRTLSSYCKIRYFMSLLRKYPRLVRAPRPVDLRRYSLLTPGNPSRAPRRAALKKSNHKSPTPSHFLRGLPKEVRAVRFYSSSNRDTFKAEAPIGIVEKASFELSSLSGRLGQSFHRLSRHINIYFKGKDAVPLAENASLVVADPEYVGRSQRRFQSQRAAREQNILDNKDRTLTLMCNDKEESAGSPLIRHISRVQLFHISSLATRFGESYSYVANHINSVFTRGFSKVQIQQNLEAPSAAKPGNKRLRRRRIQNNGAVAPKEDETSQVKAAHAAAQANIVPNSWEDSYLLFARHINRYFGAKVADEVGPQNTGEKTQKQNHFPSQFNTGDSGSATRQHREEPATPESAGLFHSSRNATGFGESYFQMSTHINQYFKGQGGAERGGDGTVHAHMDTGSAAVDPLRTVTFMDCLRHPTSAIPDLLGSYLNFGTNAQTSQKPKPAVAAPEALLSKRIGVSQRQTEELILGLIHSLGQASSPEALTGCVEALNEHLIRHPSRKALMWQEKTAVTLVRQRRAYRHHQALQSAIRETLALIGYVDPVKGRGIRVLSIDGGGTRGVVPLQVLKLLEAETGKKVHQLFDYICGVSTGAVLAFMLGLAHFSLDECADMYRRFGSEVFRQNRLVGTVKMGWTHSYYNSETWEAILREKLGERVLIKTARDETSPKVSAVSAVVNWGNSPKAFVFCNYNHKPGSLSRYAGGSGYQMWQAVRASSAAPGYFQEFTLQSDIHQDGGIIMNNPCALAVHESRLLWPNQPFQCVLSLGTGRYDNVKRAPATATSLRAKISSLICSATDTEGVHTLLDDLLAPDVYFRFNPMLSAEVSLDESRPGALDQLQRDTQVYLERNRLKLARACLVLGAERSAASRTKDWVGERAWEMKQRWV